MFPETTLTLVVDDMVSMRQLVKSQLRNLGIKTFMDADNGKTALKILNEQKAANQPIQLIVSDWNMPEMSGIDLLKACKGSADFKGVPFVMITAEGEQKQVLEAIKLGVSNYIVKPFTPQSIQEKMAAVWKKHNPGT